MNFFRLAIRAAVLLLGFTVVSTGQTKDEPKANLAYAPMMQAPSQEVNHNAPIATRQLSSEEMADLMMARKEYREAAQAFRRLTEEQPASAPLQNKLGIALQQQLDLNGALKCYERAVKLDPAYADALNNIGVIWYDKKKFGKAIRAYQKAIKIRNDMAVSYSNLGYAYFADKKYEEAISAFQEALRIDPSVMDRGTGRNGSTVQDRSVEDRAKFYFLLAKSFAESGNFDRAFIYLRKAKDDGYKSLSDVQKDPAFSAMLKLPEMQEVLAPPTSEATH